MIKTLDCLVKTFRLHINYEYNKFLKSSLKHNSFNIRSGLSLVNCYDGNDWENHKAALECKELTRGHPEHDYYKIRIPITNEDDIFDIYLIKWEPNSTSPVHYHSEYGCILNVLKGQLCEKRYDIKYDNFKLQKNYFNITEKNSSIKQYESSYIDNHIGSHKIINPSSITTAYSLHIYSFPLIMRQYRYINVKDYILPKK